MQVNLLFANPEFNLIYANEKDKETLSLIKDDIRKEFGGATAAASTTQGAIESQMAATEFFKLASELQPIVNGADTGGSQGRAEKNPF